MLAQEAAEGIALLREVEKLGRMRRCLGDPAKGRRKGGPGASRDTPPGVGNAASTGTLVSKQVGQN